MAICADCKLRGMEDEELDARMNEGWEIMEQAIEQFPILTAAGALASLDLVLADEDHGVKASDEQDEALMRGVREYLTSTVGEA